MPAIAQETLHVRVGEPIAAAARETARQRGMPLSEFVRLALRRETGLDSVRGEDVFAATPLSEEGFVRLLLSPFGRTALAKAITIAKREGRQLS